MGEILRLTCHTKGDGFHLYTLTGGSFQSLGGRQYCVTLQVPETIIMLILSMRQILIPQCDGYEITPLMLQLVLYKLHIDFVILLAPAWNCSRQIKG